MAFDRVRVRIAPSPTGDPHVGTAYMALFNYVFAKKHGGDFILRIEDTDRARAKASSEQLIMDTLRWLGLEWQEGPDKGGPYGPYRQSERFGIYGKYGQELLDKGRAYPCFCTNDRLTELRRQQRLAGQPTSYDRFCRSLSADEIKTKLAAKVPHVVRLKMPTDGVTTFIDVLRGKVEFENHRLDDQVLMKSDGFPTYHLANVVDDHLMKISHVIRAEEWISSTPKHVLLYDAFGWEAPAWVHMPLLRNVDQSKISKRHNPVSLGYYRRAGILPEVLVNFLSNMGWSFGNDVEIFTPQQMIEKFELNQINLGGPVFDVQKLSWMNQQYMHKMSDDRFVDYLQNEVFNRDYLKKLKPLALERMSRFEQFVDQNSFFFSGTLNYDGLTLVPAGKTAEEVSGMIRELLEQLDELYDWDHEHLKALLDGLKTKLGWKPKDYFMTIRYLVTGRADSPPLVESIVVIGREMVRHRLRESLKATQLRS